MRQNESRPPARILVFLVLAQFGCTSLWFAGNAVLGGLTGAFALPPSALGSLTSAVQFGFIAGTLSFAVGTVTDRFSPSRVFLVCALLGAVANGAMVWSGHTLVSLTGLRFVAGFCLAGIYPVGMKIAADYYDRRLGPSLGVLVGALVVGTAFPHLLRGVGEELPWRTVLLATSALAVTGGLLVGLFLPDGPHRRPGAGVRLTAFLEVFRKREFRVAAFGYFGHMWELYAFWAFVPLLVLAYATERGLEWNVSLWSFGIIAVGGLACAAGGWLSGRYGPKRLAALALALSGLCCLLSPVFYRFHPAAFLAFLLFWGAVVVADSPLFSTLVARAAPPALKGTALTIVNCLGYCLTIVSIQLLGWLTGELPVRLLFVFLAIGPLAGLLALFSARYLRGNKTT